MNVLFADESMVIAIYSLLGNVIIFVPVLWNNQLCDEFSTKINANEMNIRSVWNVRNINGSILDMKMICYELNTQLFDIRFSILYCTKNRYQLLLDNIYIQYERNSQNFGFLKFKKMKHCFNGRNINLSQFMMISNEESKMNSSNGQLTNKTMVQFMDHILCQIRKNLDSKNSIFDDIQLLHLLLKNHCQLMNICNEHSLNLNELQEVIQSYILYLVDNNLKNDSFEDYRYLNGKIIILNTYELIVVCDTHMIYVSDASQNPHSYKLSRIEDGNDFESIVDIIVPSNAGNIFWIITKNGNVYENNVQRLSKICSDDIGFELKMKHHEILIVHRHSNLKNKLFTNISQVKHCCLSSFLHGNEMDGKLLHCLCFFGQLSPHHLFVIEPKHKSMSSVCLASHTYIDQYLGLLDVIHGGSGMENNEQNSIYVAFGYENGGCIAQLSAMIPVQSMLTELQPGYKYLSSFVSFHI